MSLFTVISICQSLPYESVTKSALGNIRMFLQNAYYKNFKCSAVLSFYEKENKALEKQSINLSTTITIILIFNSVHKT